MFEQVKALFLIKEEIKIIGNNTTVVYIPVSFILSSTLSNKLGWNKNILS